MRRKEYACPNGCSLPPRRKQLREYNDGTYGFDFYDFTFCPCCGSLCWQSWTRQFAMTAYGLCVLLETHGEIEKADALREKLLARDGFWFCFSYLAAYSDYNYTVKPATVK